MRACESGVCGAHVCVVVLTTRTELEHVSETAEQQKPMKAFRSRYLASPSFFLSTSGSFSCSKLYVKNHG